MTTRTYRGAASKAMSASAIAGVALIAAFLGGAAPATAQDQDYGSRWDRAYRTPPPVADPYDDRDSDADYSEPPNEPRDGSRYDAPRYGDGREAIEREDADRRYQNRYRHRWSNWRYRDDEPYDDRFDGRDGHDDVPRPGLRPNANGEPLRDSQDPVEDDTKLTADGGARPYIAAVAPPRVAFRTGYAPGTVVIDTTGRKLYYVAGSTSAFAYPIGVGREGFSWTGSEKVSRIADWPDWYPPAEMRQRKPQLPERMLGGINNPLGAKAIYLGNTLYRIHGTNDPKSIGKAESSGCFRMLNQHVLHLASLVTVGTPVTVVHALSAPRIASSPAPPKRVTQRSSRPRWMDPADDGYGRWLR